jgi:hypothetical protein
LSLVIECFLITQVGQVVGFTLSEDDILGLT